MRLSRTPMWITACLTLALSALPGRAIEEPPRPPMSALGLIRDLATTVHARRALQEDRVLGPLNLGVQVNKGVLTVWGPVPSHAVGKQAIARLETIKGIAQVRPNFYLAESREKLLFDTTRPAGVPERIESAKPEIETGKILVRSREPILTVDRRDQPVNDGLKLFAPRPVVAARPESLTSAVKLPKPAASLTDQVREARQSEARFRDIVVEVQGNAVLIRRGESPGRDVMDLVEKLRHIRGVTDVILSD